MYIGRYARSTVGRYSARYAKLIHNIFTIVGHRVGHQSGLDESSERKSTTFLNGIVFRVYLAFSGIAQNAKYSQILIKTVIETKDMLFFNKTNGKPETL